jgi:single-strand DNA-binding protein
MPLPTQTLVGNLTADPELRFTPSGDAVVNFTVACSERKLNRDTQEWEDGDSIFVRCSAWRQTAENIAESCVRGTSVIVVGPLSQRSYETREGEKRYAIECKARHFAVQVHGGQAVKVSKASRSASYDGGQGGGEDPWGSAPAGGGGDQGQFADEPPF